MAEADLKLADTSTGDRAIVNVTDIRVAAGGDSLAQRAIDAIEAEFDDDEDVDAVISDFPGPD